MLVKDPHFNVMSIKHHATIFDVNKNKRKFAMGRVATHLLLCCKRDGHATTPLLYKGMVAWPHLSHNRPFHGFFKYQI